MKTISSPRDVTTYFTGLANLYSQHRPSYPHAAIAWALECLPAPVRAVDVGCGTGISTRLLAEHGANVIGIDPNADMLAQAIAIESPASSRITYQMGTGEQTHLSASRADVVVCAQSFHWFDAMAALHEFHRILKPGGRLALMWNVRDDSDPFTLGYSHVAHAAQADAAAHGIVVHAAREADPTLGGYFANVRRRRFPNPQTLDLQGLLGRARSASYFPKQDPLRGELEGRLRRLFENHARDGKVILHHNTEVTVADRVL
jgi:ubiquinone/menaquinone biosynthesis C-methylase UbiE